MSAATLAIRTNPANANYNVKVGAFPDRFTAWCGDNGIPVRVFCNMDGDGFNFIIMEFQELAHARRFMDRFGINGEGRLWAEGVDGGHYPMQD